jgi:hypothetical protein
VLTGYVGGFDAIAAVLHELGLTVEPPPSCERWQTDFEQAGKAKLARRVARTKATRSRRRAVTVSVLARLIKSRAVATKYSPGMDSTWDYMRNGKKPIIGHWLQNHPQRAYDKDPIAVDALCMTLRAAFDKR